MSSNSAPTHELAVEHVAIADLNTHPRNPRRGNVAAIRSSLLTNGQYRPIVVNRGTHTGRPNEVLAGNHTFEAHAALASETPGDANPTPERWSTLAATFVDVTDDQATRIMAADNRTADLGDYDNRILAELLSELDTLEGTGYDPDALDALEKALADATDDDWAEALDGTGGNPDGPETITRTFSLHRDHAALVDEALETAGEHIPPDIANTNTNGNGQRLTVIANAYLRATQ